MVALELQTLLPVRWFITAVVVVVVKMVDRMLIIHGQVHLLVESVVAEMARSTVGLTQPQASM